MTFLPRTLLVWLLVAVLATPASARVAYQLIVHGNNAPQSVLDKVAANGLTLLSKVLSNLPGYEALGPGQYESCPNRELRSDDGDKVFPAQQVGDSVPDEEDEEDLHRDLQLKSQCPATCSYQSSRLCRSIGCCATCGRRRRHLRSLSAVSLLTCGQVKLLEATLDTTLALACLGRLGCSLKSKILSVGVDGSVAPVC